MIHDIEKNNTKSIIDHTNEEFKGTLIINLYPEIYI